MIDYVASDLHLGHNNIIKYCNRPFESVDDMNKKLIYNWNSMVNEEDTVLYIGDLTLGNAQRSINYLKKLNGNITFIKGNHDKITNNKKTDFIIHNSTYIQQEGINFFVKHHTEEKKEGKYILQGHTHNNDLSDYPFYNPSKRRFNVSVELIGYTPIPFEDILYIIKNNKNNKIKRYTKHID